MWLEVASSVGEGLCNVKEAVLAAVQRLIRLPCSQARLYTNNSKSRQVAWEPVGAAKIAAGAGEVARRRSL